MKLLVGFPLMEEYVCVCGVCACVTFAEFVLLCFG